VYVGSCIVDRQLGTREVVDGWDLSMSGDDRFVAYTSGVPNTPNGWSANDAVYLLDRATAGYPKSQQVACGSGDAVRGDEPAAAAGASGLSYDAATDTYTYVWKTLKGWAGTCRQLVLKLDDGSYHRADFALVGSP
jgi:hypothetical protein